MIVRRLEGYICAAKQVIVADQILQFQLVGYLHVKGLFHGMTKQYKIGRRSICIHHVGTDKWK